MRKVVFDGCLYSDFEGFNDNMVFKMSNGTYWIQTSYEYWYHYAYRPKATITFENGRYMLSVCDHSIEVQQLDNVIETFKMTEAELVATPDASDDTTPEEDSSSIISIIVFAVLIIAIIIVVIVNNKKQKKKEQAQLTAPIQSIFDTHQSKQIQDELSNYNNNKFQ